MPVLQKRRVKCPYCGKLVQLSPGGKLYRHNDPATKKRCVRVNPN
jgi:ribosomal protein S27E